MLKEAGREVDRFVKNRWLEKEWETAYFINPPVSLWLLMFKGHFEGLITPGSFLCRGFKAFRMYLTYTFSHGENPPRRWSAENSKLALNFFLCATRDHLRLHLLCWCLGYLIPSGCIRRQLNYVHCADGC
jgi:hypothetical protein